MTVFELDLKEVKLGASVRYSAGLWTDALSCLDPLTSSSDYKNRLLNS